MRLNIEQQTPEMIAALLLQRAEDQRIHDINQIIRALKDHPDLLTELTPELFVEVINLQLADSMPWSAFETLEVLKECPQLHTDVVERLTKDIRFAPATIGHPHNYLLQVFSDYPQLHPAIHAFGATTNEFARLLTDLPRDPHGRFQVVAIKLTETETLIDNVGGNDCNVKTALARWVRLHVPNREMYCEHLIPAVATLLKEAATSTTVPENFKETVNREIVEARRFLAPRGIII